MSFKEFLAEQEPLEEGGAFGHLSHPYDVNMKFSDMIKLISNSLQGELEYAEEKTDGTNMLFTVKNGKVLFARNKGHLKNRGENAMTIPEIEKKFAGRDIGKAYSEAFRDIQAAIDSINKKQQNYIFNDGRSWMSVEVIGIGSDNIIPYGTSEIRFHGTSDYDDQGMKATDINKANAKVLDGMLRQRQASQQKTFHISNLNRASIPKLPNFQSLESKYIGKLKKVLSKYGVKENQTIDDYKKAYWKTIVDQRKLPRHVKDQLIKRWSQNYRKITIAQIMSGQNDKDVKWAKALDKDQNKIHNSAMKPIKDIFLDLGTRVVEQMTPVMALNPDKAVQEIRKKIDSAVHKIRNSDNTDLIKKLDQELRRLESAGNKVLPTEGLTFFYLDSNKQRHFLKLTGTFAPINTLINLTWRLE